ncbi:MAG: hypothetical protein AAF065_06900 [Verrucomicrobiota bacterium]
MLRLSKADKVELCLITVAVSLLFLLREQLSERMIAGNLITSLALTLLLHGFIRDIYRLIEMRLRKSTEPAIELRCMCLESTLGLPLVILGVMLAVVLPDWKWQLPTLLSAMLYSGTLIVGYLIKDLVITWRPLGIRRIKEHSRIHFRL